MSQRDTPSLAFIDIEASGLTEHSFPIEIGWAVLAGPSGGLLIQPAPDWSDDEWDDLAGAKHGILRTDLMQRGVLAEEVAKQLNGLLSSRTLVLTDAFDWDSYWLARLFAATSLEPQFQLGDFWHSLSLALQTGASVRVRRSLLKARRHRARDDAEQLRRMWIEATSTRPEQERLWNKP